MAEKKTAVEPAEPTNAFRWFHPEGQIATGRTLQQQWSDGEWRDVAVVNEGED